MKQFTCWLDKMHWFDEEYDEYFENLYENSSFIDIDHKIKISVCNKWSEEMLSIECIIVNGNTVFNVTKTNPETQTIHKAFVTCETKLLCEIYEIIHKYLD